MKINTPFDTFQFISWKCWWSCWLWWCSALDIYLHVTLNWLNGPICRGLINRRRNHFSKSGWKFKQRDKIAFNKTNICHNNRPVFEAVSGRWSLWGEFAHCGFSARTAFISNSTNASPLNALCKPHRHHQHPPLQALTPSNKIKKVPKHFESGFGVEIICYSRGNLDLHRIKWH